MNTIKGEKFKLLDNNKNIFYRDIHETVEFFKSPPADNFVLITHNGDGSITRTPKRFNLYNSTDVNFDSIEIPNNLVKWFSQNVDVFHDKLESIPIGLENSMWFPEIEKEKKLMEISKVQKTFKNLLYINHNINTNPDERASPYEIFKNFEWATLKYGSNGSNFDEYLTDLHSHKFVLCPSGNGIDTHRTWEVLYIGGIPIEKNNRNNAFYKDLPICFVDEWRDITEDFLNSEFDRIRSKCWNLEKLDFDFWKTKINNTLC